MNAATFSPTYFCVIVLGLMMRYIVVPISHLMLTCGTLQGIKRKIQLPISDKCIMKLKTKTKLFSKTSSPIPF